MLFYKRIFGVFLPSMLTLLIRPIPVHPARFSTPSEAGGACAPVVVSNDSDQGSAGVRAASIRIPPPGHSPPPGRNACLWQLLPGVPACVWAAIGVRPESSSLKNEEVPDPAGCASVRGWNLVVVFQRDGLPAGGVRALAAFLEDAVWSWPIGGRLVVAARQKLHCMGWRFPRKDKNYAP